VGTFSYPIGSMYQYGPESTQTQPWLMGALRLAPPAYGPGQWRYTWNGNFDANGGLPPAGTSPPPYAPALWVMHAVIGTTGAAFTNNGPLNLWAGAII
jgi:hypothetical protein